MNNKRVSPEQLTTRLIDLENKLGISVAKIIINLRKEFDDSDIEKQLNKLADAIYKENRNIFIKGTNGYVNELKIKYLIARLSLAYNISVNSIVVVEYDDLLRGIKGFNDKDREMLDNLFDRENKIIYISGIRNYIEGADYKPTISSVWSKVYDYSLGNPDVIVMGSSLYSIIEYESITDNYSKFKSLFNKM